MPSPLDTLLRPLHQWVWGDFDRRVRKLLAFAEVETDGGRDILRASELTPDPLLRRLYLEHAIDELHHGVLFRERGAALLRARASRAAPLFNGNPLPGGHGLDDLRIEGEPDHRLLAFLHVAEKSAAGRFAIYRRLVDDDPADTRHFRTDSARRGVPYELHVRAARARLAEVVSLAALARAGAAGCGSATCGIAAAIGDVMGTAVIALVYFVVLPPFAWMAKRAHRAEAEGWKPARAAARESAASQY